MHPGPLNRPLGPTCVVHSREDASCKRAGGAGLARAPLRLRTGVRSRPATRVRATAVQIQNDVRRSEVNAEAYNKAMQAYSQTPFSYRHELGLCACPATPLGVNQFG